MRNRRLLTLAVLAVAIGFAAQAEAWTPPPPYYGTAVVTLIRQTAFDVDGNSTFDINVRLWDDAGIGEPAVDTAGLIDFNIASITGGTSPAVVKSISVTAPLGEVTDDINTYGAGFTKELIYGSGGNFDVSSVQPVMYGPTPPGTNDPLSDAAILIGVGTTGREVDDPTQNSGTYTAGYFSYDPGTYAGDTPIVHGIYSGDGVLGTITFGVISFSVLPTEAPFAGPMADPGTSTTVKAVVIQTTTLAGNDGGAAASDNPTNLKVEFGRIGLGAKYISGPNVTLQVDANDTCVTMAADHTFGGLNITGTGTPGSYRGVNVDASLITVMSDDPVNLQNALIALRKDYAGPTTDGLYSSQIDGTDSLKTLVITATTAMDAVVIKATLVGDLDLNWTVDVDDYNLMGDYWLQDATSYSQGDLDGSGFVDVDDYNMQGDNWLQTFVPGPLAEPAPGVPEPATMSLLCLGALGLLRRRRRS